MSSGFKLCAFAIENKPSFFTTVYSLLSAFSFTVSTVFLISGFIFLTVVVEAIASLGSLIIGFLISFRTVVVTFSFLMIFKRSPGLIVDPFILFHFLTSETVTSYFSAISPKLSPDLLCGI